MDIKVKILLKNVMICLKKKRQFFPNMAFFYESGVIINVNL